MVYKVVMYVWAKDPFLHCMSLLRHDSPSSSIQHKGFLVAIRSIKQERAGDNCLACLSFQAGYKEDINGLYFMLVMVNLLTFSIMNP